MQYSIITRIAAVVLYLNLVSLCFGGIEFDLTLDFEGPKSETFREQTPFTAHVVKLGENYAIILINASNFPIEITDRPWMWDIRERGTAHVGDEGGVVTMAIEGLKRVRLLPGSQYEISRASLVIAQFRPPAGFAELYEFKIYLGGRLEENEAFTEFSITAKMRKKGD